MMDKNKAALMDIRVSKTIENLKRNNMEAYYLKSKNEVVPKLKELLPEGSSITVGGSMTLFECGVIDFLRSGNFKYYDRYAPGLTREQIEEVFRQAFYCDAYITSSNAVTENGELYNVDGNGNRVAAIVYGPKSVIVIAGINKIVKDLDEAVSRVKRVAAPANSIRLGCDTYCSHTGNCTSPDLAQGCASEQRICASYLISAKQKQRGRIKVIIVGEELGY